jgi:chemotaxis response regulator CheB
MKVFIIDFSKQKKIASLIPKQHQCLEVNNDGGEAYKKVGEFMPDKIFINFQHLPSHAIQTAKAIKQRKKTALIPIFFVDGSTLENHKVASFGSCISSSEILQQLD